MFVVVAEGKTFFLLPDKGGGLGRRQREENMR